MLATLIIGLREGLEAALVVGIIAAFLRRNGHGLGAMWLGVVTAILLSLAVGLGLASVEQALPQAAQEGMEAVIGVVAVVFVTGMIFWMNRHARHMKRELEAEAAEALGRSSGLALALMAFLAVLKEGFETSVFLLATFSVVGSAELAAIGAVIGLLVAALLGWGIYAGGVRLDLSRFFRLTGAFLILLAAGLVASSLRTAHEAGWLNAGQQVAMDLSWLVAPGTIRSALVTSIFGIPADPRRIEVMGWLAYIVPVCLIVYWPERHRPGPVRAARLRLAGAVGSAALAIALALFHPSPQAALPDDVPLQAADGTSVGIARLQPGPDGAPAALDLRLDGTTEGRRLPLPRSEPRLEDHSGVLAQAYEIAESTSPPEAPGTLSLANVAQLSGGRLPRGVGPAGQPGPFDAVWTLERSVRVWTANGQLLDAQEEDLAVVTLSQGGLRTPRSFRVASKETTPFIQDWQVSPGYRETAASALKQAERAGVERQFWARQLPVGLLALALILAAGAGPAFAGERRFLGPLSRQPRTERS